MSSLEFSALQVGDRVSFTVQKTGMYGEGSVIEILPWSVYPVKIEWVDASGDKHIEQFNLECFEEVQIEGA